LAAGERVVTIYLRERARAGRRLVAEALLERIERLGFARAVLLRGVEGFGHHGLESDRLLSLSEDLPLVVIAVDREERAAALLAAPELAECGAVTVERLSLGAGEAQAEAQLKLTAWLPRHGPLGGRPPVLRAVDLLRSAGATAAIALLGVDGVVGGVRRRASLLRRNAEVPALVVGVGGREAILSAQRTLAEDEAVVGVDLERVGEPGRSVGQLPSGWQAKLTLFLPAGAGPGQTPFAQLAVQEFRLLGAPGATVLRGLYGFFNGGPIEGERALRLRRGTPHLVLAVLPPQLADEAVARLAAVGRSGLLALERVPTYLPRLGRDRGEAVG